MINSFLKTLNMTDKEITDKIGTMHLRFLDYGENYVNLLNLLLNYVHSSQFGQNVIGAMRMGLMNFERYVHIDRELSQRAIVIKKRDTAQCEEIRNGDAKGLYCVSLVLDDGSELQVDPERKQSHLLYILMLLCSQKNGLMADFFLKKEKEVTPALEAVAQLVKLIYPHIGDKDAMRMARDLAPDQSFSSSLQLMKSPIVDVLKNANMEDELYWYMPYFDNIKKKKLYRLHMPYPNISYPSEFQPIVDALPDAADFLKQEGVDTAILSKDMETEFAYWKKEAEKGNAEGLYMIGVYYGTGDVVSQDYGVSLSYLDEADKMGFLDATYQIGIYYMFGFGIKKDISLALSYLERAANQGHTEAAAQVGQIYERGLYGIKKNYQKSFKYYMIAAEQDNEEAIWFVIDGYWNGHGTPKDENQAYVWLKKAQELGYAQIDTLFGIYLFNRKNDTDLKEAYSLFENACKKKVPFAFYMMGKMALLNDGDADKQVEEAKKWMLEGADLGDDHCINEIKDAFPDIYEQKKEDWQKTISLRDIFLRIIKKMDLMSQENFIQLVDAYRERWHESYLSEICKQLSIHKIHGDKGKDWTPRRCITIRRSEGGRAPYELVLTLANGEEVVIEKFNINALTLYLLAIICSYKSGYTTKMAKSEACRPVLKELVQLVNSQFVDHPEYYIDEYMYYTTDKEKQRNEDYYKQYSKIATRTIKESVENKDDFSDFLFSNTSIAGRQNLRRIRLDPQHIEMPPELEELANRMPDVYEVLKNTDNQIDRRKI